ncbi:surface lipoprotein assembly modifier [Plastoroseomonas arctica]|uniref:DUF560 domain-containing protein n=1 Tax=Plastoroseomonas arctica TaxID=1509237 RepID=A0AAF1JZK6_9PROT|nr:surface lipoprotein assembly modifier [Plastoroseomonas arctica]MBR0654531.1 DUF560 domain-containing protein [Plastoroseomonas arctica]
MTWKPQILAAALMMAVVQPLVAQENVPIERAFAEMMARPADPDLALRYARIAVARGETRAAIVALERVLRINPALDNIRLELASLRLAEGSPDLAGAFATEALRSPDMPAEVMPRAAALQAQADRASARSLLEVSLFLGARYDTNANEATSLGTVPIFVPVLQDFFQINTPVRGRSDWSLVLGARASHRYDLGLQREGAWETNFSAFEQRFDRIPRAYDLSLVTFDTGPRIGIADFGDSAALLGIRPFLSLGWLGYGGRTYANLFGGGTSLELRLPPRWSFELTGSTRVGNYENSDFRPTARDFTGTEHSVSFAVAYLVDDATRITAGVYGVRGDARREYYRRSGWGAFLAASTTVNIVPSYAIGASARAGYRRTAFDDPDPAINPDESRRDNRWEAGLLAVFPITRTIALTAEYEWYSQKSSYAIYRYDNHAVTLGVRLSF